MKRSFLAVLILACALGARAQAPARPESASPERVYTLDEALRLARNDARLQSAEQDVIIAEQRVLEARFLFLPEFGVQGSATKFDARYPFALSENFRNILLFPGAPENIYSGRGYMHMSLYEGQRTLNTLRLAQAAQKQALSNRDSVKMDLVRQIKEAFFRLLLAQERAVVADELGSAYETASRDGSLGPWERVEIEAALGGSRADAATRRHELGEARLQFLKILNLELDTPFRVEGDLATSPIRAEVDKSVVWAMELRPELQSQTYKAQMDAIGVNLALGRRYPTVFLAGEYEFTAQRFPLKNNNWAATVGFKLPFSYDFWSQIRQKRAEQRQGQLARAALQDQVRFEVRRAADDLTQWQREWPRREAQWKRVQALYDAALGKPGSALARLRAREGLVNLKLSYLTAVTEHLLARARLERAVGRELTQ